VNESEMIEVLGWDGAGSDTRTRHPAWSSFVREMKHRQYGYGALQSAWAFFKSGWDAADHDDA